VFVKTSRRFDPSDKLIREYYKLTPYINGMVKNGRRNMRHEVDLCDIGKGFYYVPRIIHHSSLSYTREGGL